jgi:hypothetical protein
MRVRSGGMEAGIEAGLAPQGIGRRHFLQLALSASTSIVWGGACSRNDSAVPDAETGKGSRTDAKTPTSQGGAPAYGGMASALRRQFDYLVLDSPSLDRYCREYIQRRGEANLARRDFYERFLLSSDFFKNGADESRPVHYLAFYDPRVTGCTNPLAKLDPV